MQEKMKLPLDDIPVGRTSREVRILARLFDGFANATRLSILLLLAREGEMRVGDLVEQVGAPQPRVSDHLRSLAQCGFVQARREGRHAYYSITDWRVLEVLRLAHNGLQEYREELIACDVLQDR
ncbi:transcriptional regulator [Rubrobacter taiwanensis]|jgi:DNA-binding transcriptional ArsR family regulator|uniref:Transcriptional regulator n=1 Tax=Rubrobacter taiwanensis TaxID=185139 RepID=A0A4R1BQ45_9ACTN|nr:metalloregulator ArsR/SmtB family transcription factor [Rubrobacter taiwanensis]TCJ19711.1 transcriptional regulator [Rubrobacter taiwanensis]